MRISVDLMDLEDLARQFERNTTELAGITLDLRRRLSTDLLNRVSAYGLPTRGLAYESERIGEALVVHVGELERFTMDLERVWAEARGLAQDGRLAPGVSGTASDLWWFRNASSGADNNESLAFAAASPQAVAGQTAAVVAGTTVADTGTTISTIIDIATAEIGYLESGGAEGNSGNITKYWAELQPGLQGQPWCAAFVSWVFLHAGFPLPPMGVPYGFVFVPTAYAHFQNIGRLFPQPLPGDIFIRADQGHTGLVTAGLDATGRFHTIEGNTSPTAAGSQSNGGGVYAKVHYLNEAAGFCRPDFAARSGEGHGQK